MGIFSVGTQIFTGEGALDRLKGLSIRKACLVCDPFLIKNGVADQVAALVREGGSECEIFSEIVPNPAIETVSVGVKHILSTQPDTVIALGGGSAIDTGKAVSYLYTKFTGKAKPRCIVIPTTSGTGSEVTSFSVISDQALGEKYPLSSSEMIPELAILDPALTCTVPPEVTADTGLDVLTHALEAYVSPKATDFTDALAEKAVALVFSYLPAAFQAGEDGAARERLHNASCMAGIAFENASLGLCHGMAHPMGALLHLPHGRCNALLLPHIIAYNAGLRTQGSFLARGRYAAMAKLLGCCAYNEEVAVSGLIQRIETLMVAVGIRPRLEENMGALLTDQLDKLECAAMADGCTLGNPRTASKADIGTLYRKLLPGTAHSR